jgi:hypothetical protein
MVLTHKKEIEMANTILHKRSSTSNSVPTSGQLVLGELALNTTDGRIYMKTPTGVVEVSYRDSRVRNAISTSGTGITYDSSTGVLSSSATSANTASAVVSRDSSGNFSAGTITAALSGNASTATALQNARTINGVSFDGTANVTVTAASNTLTGTTLASNVVSSSLTSVGTLANLTVTNTITGSVSGNAGTATKLATPRTINGVSFDGSANITITTAVVGEAVGGGLYYTDSRVKDFLASGTLNGNIIPATDNTYSLGSPTKMWKDVYVGPGSLYVNGQKVLEETSGNIVVSADINQNLVLATTGDGNVEIDPQGTGSILLKGPVQVQAGSQVLSSDGNAIQFGNQIAVDSLTSKSTNTDLTLTAAGTGKVYVNDSLTVANNLVVSGNLTINGTTTTINATTLTIADNIIDLNSNVTGTPTTNAGLRIVRGDEAATQLRWNETSKVWQYTADGASYFDIVGATATQTLTNKTIAANSNTISGLTNSNLSGTAGITNANLANSKVTVGTTDINLGSSATTIAGLTSVTSTTFTGNLVGNVTGNVTGTVTGGISGNAATATALQNARTINGVSFDGTANVTVITAGTGITISGTQISVDTSSTLDKTTAQTLSNKTLASPVITGTATFNGSTSGSIAVQATATAGTNTITLPAVTGTVITTGDTGTITSTMIADGTITNSDINASAAIAYSKLALTGAILNADLAGSIADSKLSTISTAGKVSNSATTATSANTASAIVARDASGNFTAGTITAALTGNVTGNADTATKLATARNINGVSFDGSAAITVKASTTNALTIGTGLSGTSFDGSSAVTVAIDSTVATLTGSQTLTNKTLTSPTINGATIGGSLIPSTDVTYDLGDATHRFRDLYLSGSTIKLGSATLSASGTGLALGGSAVVTVGDTGTVTNTMLAGSIANAKLSNSSVTIGSTTTALGGTNTSLAGLTSVTSTGFTGALTGNASTATALQTARTINGVSFDGSANVTTLTAGTGVTVSGTQVSIGQAVGTSSNVTFNDLTVSGNLTVNGTTTTINATTLDVADLNITVAKNALSAVAANGAGLTVNGPGTAATFTYTSADDRWNLNKNLNVTTVYGALSGNATTATTLQTARNIQGVSFNGSGDITVVTAGTGISVSGTTVTNTGILSITGTAPVSASTTSGATTISMAPATASVNGYMTSTYAAKLDGIAAGATNVTNTNQLTNGAGYITGITSANVTTALGFTPYNATNPSGYITASSNTSGIHTGAVSTGSACSTGALTVTGAITATGDVTAYYSSDRNLKTNIAQITGALTKVEAINGVTYNWNETAVEQGKSADVREAGVIAQEVQAVLPEVVKTRDNGFLAVDYEKMVALLIEAVKELSAEVKDLKSQLNK